MRGPRLMGSRGRVRGRRGRVLARIDERLVVSDFAAGDEIRAVLEVGIADRGRRGRVLARIDERLVVSDFAAGDEIRAVLEGQQGDASVDEVGQIQTVFK